MIGVDWGSSNLRAFRFGASGEVVDFRASSRGVKVVRGSDFDRTLSETIGDWVKPGADIVLAGMVGSRDGWREAIYIDCPADPASLAANVTSFDSSLGRCHIVPGLKVSGDGRFADVMRGEETQVLGSGLVHGLVILPGTHNKWVSLADGKITNFRTAVTGELYAVLLEHSLLGRLGVEPLDDARAFEKGVQRAVKDPVLLMQIFSARAEALLGNIPASSVPSYLSGLLIGSEVAAMAPRSDEKLTMIGEPTLCALYAVALAHVGQPETTVSILDGDMATARGLWTIGANLK